MTTAVADRPVRVWLYRDWCWCCRRCSKPGSRLPGAANYGYPTPGQAADAGRHHLRTDCTTTRPTEGAAA